MDIKIHPIRRAELHEFALTSDPHDTPFRKMVYAACLKALSASGYAVVPFYNCGIVLHTDRNENYPVEWHTTVQEGKRLSPRLFESSIHNSAAGYVSIQLGLTGPMSVVTKGDYHLVAKLHLLAKRTPLLFVCEADFDVAGVTVLPTAHASCYIMEAA